MKVLLINGPPGCGKDTLGRLVASAVPGIVLEKLARPLKEATMLALGMTPADVPVFESMKDIKLPGFLRDTATLRQAYIAMSEGFFKPLFGADILGRMLVERWYFRTSKGLVVTDSGFREEVRPLVKAWGAEAIRILRLHRQGCSFAADSREWLHFGDPGVMEDDFHNTTLEDLTLKAVELARWFDP